MLRRLSAAITCMSFGIVACRTESVDLRMLDLCTFAMEGGEAQDAGPAVNSRCNESCPVLSADRRS